MFLSGISFSFSMKLGDLDIENPFVQAPVAGVTDAPFRTIARQFHKGLMFTEMISAEALCLGNKRTLRYASAGIDHEPLAYQLFGGRPERIVEAAKLVVGMGASLVDINAGCPIFKVTRTGAGAALLKDGEKMAEVAGSVAAAVEVPVSVKTRLGWSRDESAEIMAALENTGIAFVTVHGRTAAQNYSSPADWTALKRTVESTSLPVIVNGDARDEASACKLLEFTGAAGVMIGRAIRGRPDICRTAFDLWHDGGFDRMSPEILRGVIKKHAALEAEMRGEEPAMRFFRKHLMWYLRFSGVRFPRERSKHISTLYELERFVDRSINSI